MKIIKEKVNNMQKILTFLLFGYAVITGITGCAIVPERHPLPTELTKHAIIPGIPEARFWGNEWPKFSLKTFETYTEEDFMANYAGVYKQPHNYLAISGGGANGAFGAGLFAGWAASGPGLSSAW